MDTRNNIATDLFYKIRSRFSGLKLGTESGEITIIPEDARFFDFDYMEGETPIGHVSISLAEQNSMKVYFSHGITETMNEKQKRNWYGFLKELRIFAKRRLLNFDPRDIAKDNLDQRDYSFLSQNAKSATPTPAPIGESIMSESNLYGTKNVSYQKLMDTRLIIKHSKTLNDDMAPGSRSRNISALFVENSDGERFKYPFKHLAGARAMQRHVANHGLPYDDLGKSITAMSEEIAQLKSFGNYVVRNDLMNSDTNNMVERSTAQLDHLRETLHKLAKQPHYDAYKENFKAVSPVEMPSSVVEEYKEKFTVRNFKEDIASVFPVIYRLMQESGIEYSDIIGMTSGDDVPVAENIKVIDQMAQFEQWAMLLGEDDAITSTDPENQQSAIDRLQELVSEPLPAGVDGLNAIESLKGIIDEPALNRAIVTSAKEDPEKCVVPIIQSWLKQYAPDVVDRLDWEHGHDSEHTDSGESEVEKLEKDEGIASECGDDKTPSHGDVDMNELFEYVKSFYDQMENKFPLGPAKVTIMVGKKFGESAASAVKKLIERMAPEQASVGIHQEPEHQAEIKRFKELAGM